MAERELQLGENMTLLLIIVVVLLFGGGFGYWGHSQWGENNALAGPGIGLGTILVIVLILFLLHVL
jgi:hypothetical protein